MTTLTITHLWFTIEATTPLRLPAQCGPAWRGALVSALRRHYCPDAALRPAGRRAEADPGHRELCPVCWLIATEDEASSRGRDVQRPYTIEPPLRRSAVLAPTGRLSFGVSLIGKAATLLPYLVLALPEMGRAGVGHFDPWQNSRGRFVLRAVAAVNPLSGSRQTLLDDGNRLHLPSDPVTSGQVLRAARDLADRARADDNRLGVEFRTPTRIVAGSHLVKSPDFGPLFQRLLERTEGLLRYGGPGTSDVLSDRRELLAQADRVETVADQTVWVEAESGSRRLGRATPVSGYQGRTIYRAPDWAVLLPWLVLGQSLHVGKSAVKGNGWYTIDGCPGWPDADHDDHS